MKGVLSLNGTKGTGASVLQSKTPYWIFYLLLFLTVFVLSALTPMVSDDFAYCFSWVDWTRIRSVGQIFSSMVVHRSVTNGRVFVHGLVQLLLLLPRTIYCILNGLNAVLLFDLARRLLRLAGWKQELLILLFGMFEIFCFLPAFGENILWLAGSINYFWGLSCSLLFLYPYLALYLNIPYMEKVPVLLLRLLLAFVFGTWSENGSLVFLFLACWLWLMHWRKTHTFRFFPLLWLIAALLGYIFLMSAPATAGRAGTSAVSVVGYNFRIIFLTAREDLLWPLIIYAVLFSLSISFHVEKTMIISSAMLVFSAVVALASYLFAAYFVPRHLCTTVFLLMLGSILLLSGLCKVERPVFSHAAFAILFVLFLLQFPVGVLDVAVSWHKQQLRETQIAEALATGESVVTLENYFPYTSYGLVFELNPTDASIGPNVNVSDYYGLDEVYGMDPAEQG